MKVGEWYTTSYEVPAFFTLRELELLGARFYINVGEKFLILQNVENLISIFSEFPKLEGKNTAFKILYNGKVCYGWFVKEDSRYYAQYKISKL